MDPVTPQLKLCNAVNNDNCLDPANTASSI